RLLLGRGAAAPRRHHRARPGTAVPTDRWHPLGRPPGQHLSPAVLVPCLSWPDHAFRPGRPTAGGARPPHLTTLLRPDRAGPGRPRPGPRPPYHRPPAQRLRHGPALAARR